VGKLERATKISGILNAFKHQPLKEEDLDEFFYKDTMEIRTGDEHLSPMRGLFDAYTKLSTSNAHLFMGHIGCGKSAELRNLKRDLEKEGHKVHMVDTLIETDPNRISQWDILILITEGLCKIADDSGVDIPVEPLEAIFNILYTDIEMSEFYSDSTSAELSAGGKVQAPFVLKSVLNLFASLKGELKVNEEARTTVTTKMPKRASEWLRHTNEISMNLTAQLSDKQPIIIFEDLDKIPYPENIYQLLSYSVLSQMPFPVIYTFPIDQFYSTKYSSITGRYTRNVLPMIKVINPNKSPNEDGIAVVRKIVELRADLSLFGKDVLETLIKKTGGSLRHLFECITIAATRADWRESKIIEHEDADRALSELRKDLTRKIVMGDYKYLLRIIDAASLEQIEDRDFQLKMMRSLIILEYENGGQWYAVHPLVAEFVNKHTKKDEING